MGQSCPIKVGRKSPYQRPIPSAITPRNLYIHFAIDMVSLSSQIVTRSGWLRGLLLDCPATYKVKLDLIEQHPCFEKICWLLRLAESVHISVLISCIIIGLGGFRSI
ncbi:hypothetical protein CBL_05284 [Carabus blaptoides fortunei]